MRTSTLMRPVLFLAPLLTLVTWAAPAAAAPPPDVTALAPARSFLVVNVPNYKAMADAFRATPLGKLWDDAAMKACVESATEDMNKGLTEFLKSVDADSKDFHPPEGQVGLALFFAEAKKDADPKGSTSTEPFTLVSADMGEHAEDYDKFIEKVLDKAVSDKQITVDHDTYADAPVTIVHPVIDEEAEKKAKARLEKLAKGEEDDEDADESPRSPFAYWIGGTVSEHRALRIARTGSLFVASTDQRAFEDALDAIKGKSIDAFADAPNIHQSLDQHAAGSVATAVLVVDRLLEAYAKNGDSEIGLDWTKLFDAWGVTQVHTVSAALHFDSQDGMAEVSLGAIVPQKQGLLELMSVPVAAFDPPSFVPSDAAGYSRFSFDFSKLFGLLRKLVSAVPEESRTSVAGPLEMARDMTAQAMSAMGPGVHLISSVEQPLSATSSRSTYAIDLKDQEAVSNTISAIIAKFPGQAEPQEFEGNQIYKVRAFGDIAFGLGFNHLFLGTEKGVQGAMRLAGSKESATLAQNAQFKDAARVLAPGAIAYSWADIEQELRFQFWTMQNATKIFEERLTQAGIDGEQRAEYLKRYKEGQPAWIEKLPPVDSVLPYVGDIASELRSTPDGFRGRILMFKPTEKK